MTSANQFVTIPLVCKMPPIPQGDASTLMTSQQDSGILRRNVRSRGPCFPEKYCFNHLNPCWAFLVFTQAGFWCLPLFTGELSEVDRADHRYEQKGLMVVTTLAMFWHLPVPERIAFSGMALCRSELQQNLYASESLSAGIETVTDGVGTSCDEYWTQIHDILFPPSDLGQDSGYPQHMGHARAMATSMAASCRLPRMV